MDGEGHGSAKGSKPPVWRRPSTFVICVLAALFLWWAWPLRGLVRTVVVWNSPLRVIIANESGDPFLAGEYGVFGRVYAVKPLKPGQRQNLWIWRTPEGGYSRLTVRLHSGVTVSGEGGFYMRAGGRETWRVQAEGVHRHYQDGLIEGIREDEFQPVHR